MKQTAARISTYSADVMGVCSALFELGGMTVMHDASGCNSTYTTHDEPRWYDMDSMVYISGISELEAIMGDDEKLISDIADAAAELRPAFIAVAGTPIPAMTGFDFEAVAEVIEQRTGIPSFGFPTTGMNTYIHGASMAFAGLAERFVDEPAADIRLQPQESGAAKSNVRLQKSGTENSNVRPHESGAADSYVRPQKSEAGNRNIWPQESEAGNRNIWPQESEATNSNGEHSGKIKVNILGLTPLGFSVNGQDESIAAWLENEGFEVVSSWAMGSSLDEIRRSAEADVNLVVSAAGLGAARVLHERFGMPYATGVPIGSELPALLADRIIMEIRKRRERTPGGPGEDSFNSAEIGVESGVFLDGSEGLGGSTYEKGFAAVIGEGIYSLSLAGAIELECGIPAKVLCATECPEDILRECDRLTPDEDDIIPELEGAAYVIADPLYRPIVPEGAKFIPLPDEAFSGRIYRDSIPDLIKDAGRILGALQDA